MTEHFDITSTTDWKRVKTIDEATTLYAKIQRASLQHEGFAGDIRAINAALIEKFGEKKFAQMKRNAVKMNEMVEEEEDESFEFGEMY